MKDRRKIIVLLSTIAVAATFVARAEQPSGPLFPVEGDGKWGFIDRTGKLIIPLQFDSANNFHEGLALVTPNKKPPFIKRSGRGEMAPHFDTLNAFSEGH